MNNTSTWWTAGLLALGLAAGLSGCGSSDRKLPILGERETTTKEVNGKEVVDTIYHSIPAFAFVNQYGDTVTDHSLDGKIYVTDFFFTSCPTICPVMKKQMIKVYNEIKGNPEVAILSHTIDPAHDTPEVLRKYAEDLGVQDTQWQFVTGPKEKIYEIGQGSYLVTAKEDKTAEGGYIHSGAFILVDKEKRVRGMYDGTTDEGAKKLMEDIKVLLAEYKQS
ncbi:SCO family protein [Rhabdobacter roseus]|uniref:Protein SCO1/2 n=1 Tax=Rhabdobacter roseus TaxID=1655419 RepID=A0A840TZH9_9BACT|nr:SCO family protein [Rhabdobacter roseus]MBB5286937.1 protein SCO1/2 [Rhabdobacter roseus]